MSAYLIVDVTRIADPDAYRRYTPLVPPTLDRYGGEYLARGGAVTVLEGEWSPSRVVVVRFDSVEAATRWWASAEYAQPKQLRHQAAATNMIVVDGI
jgi:uncharacterized protein (DUF1330 family)